MSITTNIGWAESTWNPWYGCTKISPGCKRCYMYRELQRFGQDPTQVVRAKTTFTAPLRWREGRLIFTCSWADFFIAQADAWRDEAWEIIQQTPQHRYLILTKRPERIPEHLPEDRRTWPWPHVGLGVSIESRAYRWRADILRQIPAAVRFLSLEPLLEDLGELDLSGIDWVIVGGESGPGARPMAEAWVVKIRDHCLAAGVKFFFLGSGVASTRNGPDASCRGAPGMSSRSGRNVRSGPSPCGLTGKRRYLSLAKR